MDWETIYTQHRRYVWTVCFRLLGNEHDTEDAVQETFIRAMSKIDTFDAQKGSFKSWLARIAHNVSIDILRRRGRFTEYSEDTSPDQFEEPEMNVVQLCMEKLPRQQRIMLILKRSDGCGWEEIAEMTGLTVEQARYLEKKAREAMKNCISAE